MTFSDDNKAREALAQYASALLSTSIARCPISLKKIIYESAKGNVIFKTKYNEYFKENVKIYDLVEFIGLAVQHTCVELVEIFRSRG
jgi:hypothetical protein